MEHLMRAIERVYAGNRITVGESCHCQEQASINRGVIQGGCPLSPAYFNLIHDDRSYKTVDDN